MRHAVDSRRRHPSEGGYARGEETRARIIATALRIFGEQGYVQASTRHIAHEAGVNPPALQYYFDSKEGLHRACAQHIIDRVSVILAPALAQARAVIRDGSRAQVLSALSGLLDALADGLVAAGSESWSRFVARGKADGGGPTIELIRERIGRPLMMAASELIALATGRAAHDDVTRLRASLILGQVSTFYANRESTLATMNWSGLDAQRLKLIKSVVREHTRAVLRTGLTGLQPAARARKRPRRRSQAGAAAP